MKTPVSVLLTEKKNRVYSVSPDSTVEEAVHVMNDRHIGSVVVVDDGLLVGIFTERDVLQRIVASNLDPSRTRISQVMTRELTTITPETEVSEAMELMATKRHRHLPVIEDGNLVGLISIGDATRYVSHSFDAEAGSLWNYISGDSSLEVAGFHLVSK